MLIGADPCAEDPGIFAERLQTAIGEPCRINGREAMVSSSIGIALYPEHGPNSALIAHAEAAMRSAKSGGGAGYAFFEQRMISGARDQLDLLRDLRRALAEGQLHLVYQPKIHAPSGEITGAEALMRWNHPQRGLVGPDEFIPIAERFGLIGAMGNWLIEEACRQAGAWRDEGLQMRVAINLSAHQLRHPDLADRIDTALRRHRINPQLLTCEITESVAMEDASNAIRMVEQLGAMGVNISIDDFGTGYSSLAYLRKLRAGELKIDRSFVLDLETSADARAVVDARRQAGAGARPEGRRRGRRDRGAAPDPALVRLPRAAGLPVRPADVGARALDLGDGGRRPARARLPRFALPRDGRRRPALSRACRPAARPRLPTIGAMNTLPYTRGAALAQILKERIVILDGAMGTMIQRHPALEADYRGARFKDHGKSLKGNNDLLQLTRPDVIAAIHEQYLEAGADIVETNTFGATSVAQADYDLGAFAREINVAGARLARAACDRFSSADKPRFVAGALGPTPKTASISPDVNDPAARNVTFAELRDAYREQAEGLLEGGCDLFLVETIFDTLNAKAAIFALDELMEVERRALAGDRLGHRHRCLGAHPLGADRRSSGTRAPRAAADCRPQLRTGRGAHAPLREELSQIAGHFRQLLPERRPAQSDERYRLRRDP